MTYHFWKWKTNLKFSFPTYHPVTFRGSTDIVETMKVGGLVLPSPLICYVLYLTFDSQFCGNKLKLAHALKFFTEI